MAFKPSAVATAAMFALALPAFAQDAADAVKDAANAAADSVAQAGDAMKDAGAAAGDKAAKAADQMLNDGKNAAAEAADTAKQAMDKVITGGENAAADAAAATGATAEEASQAMEKVATEGMDKPAADAPADAAPAADAATAEAPAADAAPAEAADAEPQPGAYYIRATHTDWTLRCIKAAEGADPCELYQLLKDDQGNSVAEMTMIPLGGKIAAGATLVAPLETDLMQGIGLRVDSGKARGYPFNFCAPVGCVSRMGFTPEELSQFKRGNEATVSLLPFGADPKNPVMLKMSLSGFTAAYDELSAIVDEQKAAAGN